MALHLADIAALPPAGGSQELVDRMKRRLQREVQPNERILWTQRELVCWWNVLVVGVWFLALVMLGGGLYREQRYVATAVWLYAAVFGGWYVSSFVDVRDHFLVITTRHLLRASGRRVVKSVPLDQLLPDHIRAIPYSRQYVPFMLVNGNRVVFQERPTLCGQTALDCVSGVADAEVVANLLRRVVTSLRHEAAGDDVPVEQAVGHGELIMSGPVMDADPQPSAPSVEALPDSVPAPIADLHSVDLNDAPVARQQSLDDSVCVVCLDAPKEAVLVPCGHLGFCMRCAENLRRDKCPVCRQPIDKVIRTYRV